LSLSSNALANWTHSNGNFNSTNYSELSQINRNNISKLQKEWIYNSGQFKIKDTVQATPIFTGKYLIICTSNGEIHSINPGDGKLVWKAKLAAPAGRRGLVFDDGKIFVPTRIGVVVLDENTGKILENFGKRGYFGSDISLVPPIIFGGVVYIATLNNGVQSYNLKDGSKIWHTNISPKIIAPSDGKIRIWSGFSFDEKSKTLFIVTSNMGGIVGNDRTINQNDYSSSLVAINSDNGEIIWSFQDVKNDLWDFDIAGPPLITDINFKNKLTRVVIALSKTGNVIIYDIENKKLLHQNAFEFINVPPSDVENVNVSKFQKKFIKPKPVSKVFFNSELDLNILSQEDEEYFKFKLRNTKYGNYLPPSLNNDIVTFGLHGGPSWPGSSLSADKKNIIFTINEYPWFIRLFYRDKIFSKLSIFSNKIENLLNGPTSNKKNNARWANDEIKSKYADKIYSFLPILGQNKIFLSKCASCHGVAGQGFIENESFGDKYYPPLTGITLNEKVKNLKNLSALEFAHKYEKDYINLNQNEFNKLYSFLLKRDKFLNNLNLLAISGKWQIFLNNYKLPASRPPWGKIISVNISDAKINWEIPFGEEVYRDENIKGLPNFGGIVNIGSNIFFATGTTDERIYAFDVKNGEMIWEDILPAAGSAPPMSFEYNGCQYIIVNATGGRFVGFKKNLDATVAYKLNTCKF
tara:strand:+ start:1529 stop:3607 length:2079 start_codon:yes stop_codon:yes gene_type:complete